MLQAQQLRRLPGVVAPGAVPPVGQLVAHLRVDHQHGEPVLRRVEGHLLAAAVGEVDQQGVPLLREDRSRLVEAAGRGADGLALGAHACPDQLLVVAAQLQEGVDRHGHAALEGGRAGQPGTHRHVAGDLDVEPLVDLEGEQHPRHVEHPGRGVVEVVDATLPGTLLAGHPDEPVVAPAHARGRGLAQGEGQAPAAVVVEVLPDQVDPAGGTRRHRAHAAHPAATPRR